jgi:hypothetical protein
MVERGKRWAATFATREGEYWLDYLAGHNFRCEPALRAGETLRDSHLCSGRLPAATGPDLVRFGPGWRPLPPGELAGQALRPHARQYDSVGEIGRLAAQPPG